MASTKKTICAAMFSIVLALLALGLFIALCWVAAADAQGAIAFFVYAPVLLILLVISFLLGRYAGATNPIGMVAKRASIVSAIFYLVFYVSPFIGLGSFTDGVIRTVAKSSKMVTGKTPMEWNKNY